MAATLLEQYRYFLKDYIRLSIDFAHTDQIRGVPPPPIEKPFSPDARRIQLVPPDRWKPIGPVDLTAAIRERRSHRHFARQPLTLDELSFLLWATHGITHRRNGASALRTVPSAGCRHALESYLCVFAVSGLPVGLYRYLPLEHELLFEYTDDTLADRLAKGALGQDFVARGAVTLVWTAIPYRMEWRYGLAAHKVIALDAGHVCQNLYLAAGAIGAGTCAIGAYNQKLMDEILRVDGKEEFTIYLAPVGKITTRHL